MITPEGAQPAPPKLTSVWAVVSLTTIVIALGFRLSNVVARGGLADYDGGGHLMNTVAILNGTLPHPTSWSGHHPPLYYAIAALLVWLAPDTLPMHVTLRLLSLAAGLGALVWSWRILVRRCDAVDAMVVSVFLGCTPVVVLATSMLGNETLCAFFVTATLAGLVDVPSTPRAALRRSARNGLFAGLAVVSKATGLLVAATAVVNELVRRRGNPSAALKPSLVALAIPALLVSPWLAWWLYWHAPPHAALSGLSVSPELNAMMRSQTTTERSVGDYLRLPAAALLEPSHMSADLKGSVFGLLYASAWGDVHQHFFVERIARISVAERLVAIGGLLPCALALLGAVRILSQPRRWGWTFAPLFFLILLLVGFVINTWRQPAFSVVKASFLLSGILPASILLVAGLEALPRIWRTALRCVLIALALLAVLTFQIAWRRP